MAAVALLVAIATGIALVVTNSGANGAAGPAGTSSTTDQTLGSIRSYPSIAFTPDPNDVRSQQDAQRAGAAWAAAVADQDLAGAKTHMCKRSQGLSERALFGGLKRGSLRAGTAAVNGMKGTLPLTYIGTDGTSRDGAAPMLKEGGVWTVCPG